MNVIRFSAEEAALSFWRRRRASVLSVLTIAIALFVLGGFLLVNVNVQRWIGQWTSAAELSVYLDDHATAEDRSELERALAESPIVAAADFVSHDEALQRFRRLFPDLAEAAAQLGDRPLPASYEVRLRPGEAREQMVTELATALSAMSGVDDVRHDRRWIDRLRAVVQTGRSAGLLLAVVLVAAATLTVASVIRLALHARQQEVEIMHLVGAPLGFIRGPFVIEGVLQGGVGAVAALAALYGLYQTVRVAAADQVAGMVGPDPALTFLPWPLMLGLLAGGMLVGCIGGFIAARSAR